MTDPLLARGFVFGLPTHTVYVGAVTLVGLRVAESSWGYWKLWRIEIAAAYLGVHWDAAVDISR